MRKLMAVLLPVLSLLIVISLFLAVNNGIESDKIARQRYVAQTAKAYEQFGIAYPKDVYEAARITKAIGQTVEFYRSDYSPTSFKLYSEEYKYTQVNKGFYVAVTGKMSCYASAQRDEIYTDLFLDFFEYKDGQWHTGVGIPLEGVDFNNDDGEKRYEFDGFTVVLVHHHNSDCVYSYATVRIE